MREVSKFTEQKPNKKRGKRENYRGRTGVKIALIPYFQ